MQSSGVFSPPQNAGPLSQLLSLSSGSNKTRAAEKSCKERGWAGISHPKGCPGGISVPIQCPAHFSLQDRADLPPSLLCPLCPISHSFVGKKKGKIRSLCCLSSVWAIEPHGTAAPCSQTLSSPKAELLSHLNKQFIPEQFIPLLPRAASL